MYEHTCLGKRMCVYVCERGSVNCIRGGAGKAKTEPFTRGKWGLEGGKCNIPSNSGYAVGL